jgi:hypothetical protein
VISAGTKCFETRKMGNTQKVNLAFYVPLNKTENLTQVKNEVNFRGMGTPITLYIKVKISLLQAMEAHRVARG